MALRILHTADWHLGQTFYEYDRSYEHQCFLDRLIDILYEKAVDVLLVSGDVFDVANPSTTASRMYYRFLYEATSRMPGLQIVIIAGNHDSPGRLEAPGDLLEAFRIRVIGHIEYDADLALQYDKLLVPLNNKQGKQVAWCLAVPFIRLGDYPQTDPPLPYEQGIAGIYHEVYDYALTLKQPDEFVIAMGHLLSMGADSNPDDRSERPIMGGLEVVPSQAFDSGILYTALGHIHKAQCMDRERNIWYSGSPLPMSFSELNYHHRVLMVDIDDDHRVTTTAEEIPATVTLLRIPAKPLRLQEVLSLLVALPDASGDPKTAPYLEVLVSITEPEPSLKSLIETAVKDKQVRLARITPVYPQNNRPESPQLKADELHDIQPLDIFKRRYFELFHTDIPDDLVKLFNEVTDEAYQKEAAQ